MSEYKRRDLNNYFKDGYIEEQKQLYKSGSLKDVNNRDFLNFIVKNDYFDKSLEELDENILNQCSSIFNVNKSNLLIRPNFYEAIDSIFETILEIYESVVITGNSDKFYERNVLINKGKVFNFNTDFKMSDVSPLSSKIRSTNAKALVISTRVNTSGDLVPVEFIENVIRSSPCLVILDDFYNDYDSLEYVKLVAKYSNVLIIKSFYCVDYLKFATNTFLISDKNILNNIYSLSNYFNTGIFEKTHLSFILNSIKEGDSTDKTEVTQSKVDLDELIENSNNIDEISENDNSKDEDKQDLKTEVIKAVMEEIPTKKSKEDEEVVVYEPNLKSGDKEDLINEVTKFEFISIFSSNDTHVYILSRTPIYLNLVEHGIILKKYNSSNGEIIRLTIDSTKQNNEILKIIKEIASTRRIFDIV